MFEKIVDFHNAKFSNLWKGFSCECFIEDDKRLITFRKDELEILVEGEEANDLLDFVLSFFMKMRTQRLRMASVHGLLNTMPEVMILKIVYPLMIYHFQYFIELCLMIGNAKIKSSRS